MTTVSPTDSHHEVVDVVDPHHRPRVLMVVANPAVSTTTGWPVGFWAAELFHPYYECSQKRYDVTIARFYEARKPTAALCHGVSSLIDVQLSDGSYLVQGKTVTGFANVEEDFGDAAVGQRIMPYRIQDELRKRGANYEQAGLFKAFAVRDMNLITGQQQYSGKKVAELVIAALGD